MELAGYVERLMAPTESLPATLGQRRGKSEWDLQSATFLGHLWGQGQWPTNSRPFLGDGGPVECRCSWSSLWDLVAWWAR
jgi:hypothetical protein